MTLMKSNNEIFALIRPIRVNSRLALSPCKLLYWARLRIHRCDSSIRQALQRGSIFTQQLAPPPCSLATLGRQVSEPILPDHSSDFLRRSIAKWISRKQRQRRGIVLQQALLGAQHKRILTPGTQGSEPQ